VLGDKADFKPPEEKTSCSFGQEIKTPWIEWFLVKQYKTNFVVVQGSPRKKRGT